MRADVHVDSSVICFNFVPGGQLRNETSARTASAGALGGILKTDTRIQELSATNRTLRFVVWKHKITTD